VCVFQFFTVISPLSGSARSPFTKNEIMTSSITKHVTSLFSKHPSLSSIASKSHRFSPFFANTLVAGPVCR
jgi:hypothetical protein